jgi:DNA primase
MSKKPFVDFRDIRARITMEQVLARYNLLDTFQRDGQVLIGPCPIHRSTNQKQFHVDTEKNIWTCFSECKHGGNTLDFIAKMEGIPIHDAALKACEWFTIPLEEVQVANDEPENEALATARIVAKSSPPPADDKPNPLLKLRFDRLRRDHPFLTREHGLTQETIIDFGIGFYPGDRGMMVGRIVIPIHNINGELVAYAGCFPDEVAEDTPRYKLPPNFNIAQEVFNLDRAGKEPGTLVIVNDFFDAFKLHQHGCRKVIALWDSSLSPAQEELIRQHMDSNSHVLIVFGGDDVGLARRDAVATRLSKFCYVKTHVFAQPNMRVAHLTAEEVRDLLPL